MPAHTRRARLARPPRSRRVSGPLRPLPASAPAGFRRGTTGVFERLRALPEHRVVDGLLRGRAWIWLIGLLLGGIVAMQVSLLKLNAGISRAVTTAGTLERQNAELEAQIGQLSSAERIRVAAAENGLVTPPAGAVEYLRARPDRDGPLAARRMQPPSDAAAAVMANGGREPGVLALPTDPAATGTAPTDPAPTDPAATATTSETATAPTDPAASAPPATTADPAATGTTPAATDPATSAVPDSGAAVAPGQG